jgi:class 3 adenylate cyclase
VFADIAGFTAWSSVREPSQVFVLLETVYRAFDHIAKRRKVFKVETVGDCYVRVTLLIQKKEIIISPKASSLTPLSDSVLPFSLFL